MIGQYTKKVHKIDYNTSDGDGDGGCDGDDDDDDDGCDGDGDDENFDVIHACCCRGHSRY